MMLTVTKRENIPAGKRAEDHDHYHMYAYMGTNVTVMMENHKDRECKRLYVYNTVTGENVMIEFSDETEAQP